MNYTAAAVWAVASLGLPLARESSSSQSPQDPPWSTQPRTPLPTWGFQRSPSSGGGVAVVEEGALSRPACPAPGRGGARSSHGRGRRGSLSCWLHLACGACGHRCSSEAIRPWGWLGSGEARQSVQGLQAWPESGCGAAVCFQGSWVGTSEQPPPGLQRGFREGVLALLHWRRGETEPRDCVQALPGMTWEAWGTGGIGASCGPGTTAGNSASSSTPKSPPDESLGPSPVMLDCEGRRVRASERRREGLLGT